MSDYLLMIVFCLWWSVISLLLHFNTDDGGYFLFTAVVFLLCQFVFVLNCLFRRLIDSGNV